MTNEQLIYEALRRIANMNAPTMESNDPVRVAREALSRLSPEVTYDFTVTARTRTKTGILSALEDVDEFHRAIPEHILQNRVARPALTRRSIRWRLLKEEVEELEAAIMENDIEEVADAYADIIYIVLGSAIMHLGKERFARVWDEVHRSNMAKCTEGKMVMRDDGKILKPEGWTPPNIKEALRYDLK